MTDICLCGIAREDCDYHKPAPVVSQVPVYDVSGTSFIPGVTNFTIENLFDATVGMDDILDMVVHPALYNRINKNGLLDSYNDGTFRIQGIVVKANMAAGKTGNVYDSTITALDGSQVILRTREA